MFLFYVTPRTLAVHLSLPRLDVKAREGRPTASPAPSLTGLGGKESFNALKAQSAVVVSRIDYLYYTVFKHLCAFL